MLVNALLRYYNDVWIYDIDKLEWRSVGKQGASGPAPEVVAYASHVSTLCAAKATACGMFGLG